VKKNNASVAAQLSALLENSPFLKKLKAYEEEYNKTDDFRSLTPREIEQLKAQGNYCADWPLISAAESFSAQHVIGNAFFGSCLLGCFDGAPTAVEKGIEFPNGIYNSTIIAGKIESGALVANTSCVSHCLVKSQAVIFAAGNISSTYSGSYGNGTQITAGNEMGGREIRLIAEMDFDTAAYIIMHRDDESFLQTCNIFYDEYIKRIGTPRCVVESGAVIKNTTVVRDCFIGSFAVIDGAALVEDSAVLSSKEEPVIISGGSIVRKSCLQWGSVVSDMAIADSSLFTGHCELTRHGKARHCVIGANTQIAGGEAASSLVGPFTGYHHQSLLIAALWPQGRGNIGYGANVGSNHTGKAPDQEIVCGEGVFFGLGTSVKFPANYMAAPYSIIATGVCTQSQRVEFPFSLINTPSHTGAGIPVSYNEISPGWVLANNIYALIRNEKKFMERNRSPRLVPQPIFRPEIIDMMIRARNILKSAEPREFYTDREIPELGKNYMTARSRTSGIESYNFYIRCYTGRALWNHLTRLALPLSLCGNILQEASADELWEHARLLILSETSGAASIPEELAGYAERLRQSAEKIMRSKGRDDDKGRLIIDDYEHVNLLAADDPLVTAAVSAALAGAISVEKYLQAM
jgi:carbonic anhydrase/acetyltransferase-like protein (isoleucine patch superfamily)